MVRACGPASAQWQAISWPCWIRSLLVLLLLVVVVVLLVVVVVLLPRRWHHHLEAKRATAVGVSLQRVQAVVVVRGVGVVQHQTMAMAMLVVE